MVVLYIPQHSLLPRETRSSFVTHGASECWGTYNSNTGLGYGAGYINNCIHSGINSGLNSDTVWYNYVTASAGTIVNESASDDSGNMNTATQNICPKGWNLPSKKQIDSNRNNTNFNPVLGGYYANGILYDEDTYGYWWGSEAYNGARQYRLNYNGSSLYTSDGGRLGGFYIRCVSEEKTVTDLTYMQDIILVEPMLTRTICFL